MYYLIIQNLGVERCIHSSEKDVYPEQMSLSCTPDLEYPGGEYLREIEVNCTEIHGPPIRARVYHR